MLNLIFHLFRYAYNYNYRPFNCQLEPIECVKNSTSILHPLVSGFWDFANSNLHTATERQEAVE